MDGLHPASLLLTLSLGIALLVVPRRLSMAPIVLAAIFVPVDQRLVVGGFDFTMLRVLVLFAVLRVVTRQEQRGFHLLRLDKLLLALILTVVVAYSLREGTTSALVNRLGWAFEAIGIYFYCRLSLRSVEDVFTTIQVAAPCAAAVAVFMGIESVTGRNLFSVIGGVPELSMVRNERLRAQGAFSHPILAGLFGATFVPVFAAMWRFGRRTVAVVGVAASLAMVGFSASSTPVGGTIFGVASLALWPYRGYTRHLRWGAVALALVLHVVREKPVWHLLSRINIVGGSTGWHRYHLIDQAIEHFDEWWLAGTADTGQWGYFLADVTNEYILAGVRGGLLAMLLTFAVLVAAFAGVGRASKTRLTPPPQRFFAWALGSMLVVHAVSFVSVSYFGQMRAIWYLHLAMVAVCIEWYEAARRAARAHGRPAAQPAPVPVADAIPAATSAGPSLARPHRRGVTNGAGGA